MVRSPFGHDVEINPDELCYEPFKETQRVRGFDSGSKPLDDFLNTEEVEKYEEEGLGATTLVFYHGEVVAYLTTSNDGLRLEYLKRVKSFSKFGEMKVDVVPAVKIGRLAVAKNWQSKGVGRYIIAHVAGMALESRGTSAVRLLIVQSKPESVSFYEKCGFIMTVETKRERGRANRTMFFDLHSIDDVA